MVSPVEQDLSLEPSPPGEGVATDQRPFRFFDNREKYLLFVTTCSEKWVVADRVGMELEHLEPRSPALRIFDAGMGDGTVLTKVLRQVHDAFPAVPVQVVAKEISLEDVRLSLDKLADRFHEHPETVIVMTNMRYSEAPTLTPSGGNGAALNWQELALTGSTSHDFDQQIRALQPSIAGGWRTRTSPKTGNPQYVQPTVLVIYRQDRRFILDPIIPQPGDSGGGFDLIIASQPFQARSSAKSKVRNVLAPLSKALAPGGRMLVIQSTGRDPAMEIIRAIWPNADPFATPRGDLVAELHEHLGDDAKNYVLRDQPDHRHEFRFTMHTLPTETGSNIGTSTLLAAWNAAVYVAQIEDERLNEVLRSDAYLKATWEVLQKYGGLWFVDESFVVERLRR